MIDFEGAKLLIKMEVESNSMKKNIPHSKKRRIFAIVIRFNQSTNKKE